MSAEDVLEYFGENNEKVTEQQDTRQERQETEEPPRHHTSQASIEKIND